MELIKLISRLKTLIVKSGRIRIKASDNNFLNRCCFSKYRNVFLQNETPHNSSKFKSRLMTLTFSDNGKKGGFPLPSVTIIVTS